MSDAPENGFATGLSRTLLAWVADFCSMPELVSHLGEPEAANGGGTNAGVAASSSATRQAAPQQAPVPVGKTAVKSKVSIVEPGDDEVQVAAQKPLGVLNYRGRSFTLWAMTDPTGAIVTNGGKRPLADLARMNELGAALVDYSKQMSASEIDWRQKVDGVRKAAAQSATEAKKVETKLPEMRKLRKDGGIFEALHGYLKALGDANGVVGHIRSAEKGLNEASLRLKSAEFWKQANEKENEKKDHEKAVEDKKAEMAEARRVAGVICGIVEKVMKQEWSALATQALEYARDKAIDASVEKQFGRDLADLQAQLDKAKSELQNITNKALLTAIEAERAGVEKALQELENAKGDFQRTLEELQQMQTHADDVLGKSPSTALLSAMLDQRTKQLSAIAAAQDACGLYGRMANTVRKGLMPVATKYGAVGSWLNDAAGADRAFDRSKPYAKILERSALGNAVEIGHWDDWLAHVQDECAKSLAWLADNGATGPMAHFEQAIEISKKALTNVP